MDGMEIKVVRERKASGGDLCMRVLAMLLTLVAAVLLGAYKQTKVVPLKIVPTLPAVNVPVTAKWKYLSAFVFHVVSNAIACAYAAISILALMANKGGKRGGVMTMMIVLLDLAMVALLFSASGAAGAVGLIGFRGNSHVMWHKVCPVFDKFCHRVAAALALSFFGSLAFFTLVAAAVMRSLKKTN